MTIWSSLSMMACGNKNEAVAGQIESYLQKKYGEEFVVDAIGGGYGTVKTNVVKAVAYPKAYPYKKFDVEISKDLTKVWDKYMNVIMAEKLDQVATNAAKPLFGQDIWVKTELDSGGLNFPDIELNDRNMSIKAYPYYGALIKVFVRSDSDIDADRESQNIERFLDRMIEEGIQRANVSVFYLNAEDFGQIESIYARPQNIYDYFREGSSKVSFTYAKIEEGKRIHSESEIKSNFYMK